MGSFVYAAFHSQNEGLHLMKTRAAAGAATSHGVEWSYVMIKQIFSSQTKNISSAAFLLGASALGSRFLGLVRDRLLAGTFGAGEELDIYFAAFRIPDFVYALLITGGISAVFLPVFSGVFQRDHEEGWRFANNVLNVFLVGMVVLCGMLVLATPWIIHLVVPGFSPENKTLAIALTRIMFLSPVLFGIASVFSGILHYSKKFLVYSIAPLLYNVGIIAGIVFFVRPFGLYGLTYGVLLGALFYLLIQVPAAMHSGWHYHFFFQFKQPELRKILRLMIPRIFAISASQFNLLFVTAVASALGTGSIAIFNFSNNLQYFPIGLIGVSFAIAAFPVLSQAWAENNRERFLDAFSSAVRQVLFLTIPMSVLLFLLRAQIVRLILGTGQFGWLETRLTAASLGIFSLGIFAASVVPLAARAFFSLQDTKTPALIGVAAVTLNIIFALIFVWLLGFSNVFSDFMSDTLDLSDIESIGVLALPLAISLSAIVHVFLLFSFLRKKIGDIRLGELSNTVRKIFIASICLGAVTYAALQLVAQFLNLQTFLGILLQTVIASGIGIGIYLFVALSLKMPEISMLGNLPLPVFHKARGEKEAPIQEISPP